jgi:hypothetical protein
VTKRGDVVPGIRPEPDCSPAGKHVVFHCNGEVTQAGPKGNLETDRFLHSQAVSGAAFFGTFYLNTFFGTSRPTVTIVAGTLQKAGLVSGNGPALSRSLSGVPWISS